MSLCKNEVVEQQIRMSSLKRKRALSEEKDDDDDHKPPTKQMILDSTNCPSLGSSVNELIQDSSPLYITSDDENVDFTNLPHTDCDTESYSDDNQPTPSYDEEFISRKSILSKSFTIFRRNCNTGFKFKKRKSPFPPLSWANPSDVWHKMCEKDAEANTWTSHNLFDNHPGLQMRMRAILLDWIIEVCEVYKLHRETFHLTVNYLDRYLSATKEVYKGRLQLIGITCLFIAAKVEEIYPPKIGEFAYVTDGACTKEDIISEEMIILQTLRWRTTPNTINRWLNTYMQLYSILGLCENSNDCKDVIKEEIKQYTFILPQYSSLQYVICGQLIDLAVLHVGVNAFPYSVIAAAVVAHVYNKDVATKVSSYKWEEIQACYEWLIPFNEVLDSDDMKSVGKTLPDHGADFTASGGGLNKICPKINLDQSHSIQMHNICLDQFDKVQEYVEMNKRRGVESTPTTTLLSTGSMPVMPPITPPYSDQKTPGDILDYKTPTHVTVDI